MRPHRILTVAATSLVVALGLSACGGTPTDPPAGSASPSATPDASPSATADDPPSPEGVFPITIEHAYGVTTITEQAERVATVAWANHEVPLSLGVVPVGMAAANFADEDGDGLLPWVKDRLDELGAEVPVLFDESDGIDFEAVADTDPDVILAAYSGLSQEDYDTLSKIAPVVPFPESPWTTSWREMIRLNAAGMGMPAEGDALIADLEGLITAAGEDNPVLAESSVMFVTHVDVSDLSVVNFYTPADTRVQFFVDLGMQIPASIAAFQPDPANPFAGSVSAENADTFDDVDVIVTYGDQSMIDTLKADPLLGLMPAIANDAVVLLDGSSANATAANPTPLQLPYLLDWYVDQLVTAAERSQ